MGFFRKVGTSEAKAGFVFHHSNAFERDGKIVVDSICYEELPTVEPGSDFRSTSGDFTRSTC